jgi:hypothetical protein
MWVLQSFSGHRNHALKAISERTGGLQIQGRAASLVT